jgi:GPH family glycoside/pentoside/hexuronide:cation symporter
MTDPRPPLSTLSKITYSIGSIGFGLKAVAMGVVMLFYNQVMGLPATWVSIGIGMALIVDAVVGPLIGQVSDMWRSRWGRRHPFMYFSAVPTAVAVWALLNPPRGWAPDSLFIYMMSCIVVARVFIAMFEIPNASLLPELAPDYDDRTVISGYRYLFGIVGPIVVSVFALTVLLTPFVNESGQQLPGQLNPVGYGKYGLLLAVVIFLAIVLSACGTHREIRYLRAPVKHTSRRDLYASIAAALLNRNFIALTMAGVISGIGAGLVGGLNVYFNTYFWELSARQLSVLTASVAIGPFAAVAICPLLTRAIGKKAAAIWTFSLSLFAGIVPIGLRVLGLLPPNGHPIILPLLIVDAVIAVTLVVVALIVVTSMMADIVEQVQAKTGRRSEGLLFSVDTLLKQVVTGVGSMGTGFILQFVHFPESAVPGQVPAEVLQNLALVYLPITAVTSIVAISAISFFSISRSDHERNLATAALASATADAERAG